MMVVNSFDLWQKDVFFSAAEEVQKSADIMESTYRLWIREKTDEICKELQAALGTAKWQLEEFEKEVRLSHRRCGDDSTLTRHKQFVSAIENQIHRIQNSLQGKQPLRWVDLSEEEREELAMFLSGSSQSSSFKSNGPELRDNNEECVIEIEGGNTEKTGGARRTWSSPNFNDLRIIVPSGNEEEEEKEKLVAQIEATPKVKGTKSVLWMHKLSHHTQLFDKISCFRNRIHLSFNHPIKLTISLMLMVFLLYFHLETG